MDIDEASENTDGAGAIATMVVSDAKAARIVVTNANGQQQTSGSTGPSLAPSMLSRRVKADSELGAAPASTDMEEAMSGISDDVPILLQATIRAAAAAAATSAGANADVDGDGVGGSEHGDAEEAEEAAPTETDGQRDGESADPEADPELEADIELDADGDADSMAATPLMPPSSSFMGPKGSQIRARSPLPALAPPAAKGKGGKLAKGKGKKGSAARLLQVEDMDGGEVSASGNEDGAERDGSPHPETPVVSDHEEGVFRLRPLQCMTEHFFIWSITLTLPPTPLVVQIQPTRTRTNGASMPLRRSPRSRSSLRR
jgi:hypothetical protein